MKLRTKLMIHSMFGIILSTLLVGFILIEMLNMKTSDKDSISALVTAQKLESAIVLTQQALSNYSFNATYGNEAETSKQLKQSDQVLGELKDVLDRLTVKQEISSSSAKEIQASLAVIVRKWELEQSSARKALTEHNSFETNRQSIRTLGVLNDLFLLQRQVRELYDDHTAQLESEIRMIIWICSLGVILLIAGAYVSNDRLTQQITRPLKALALQAQAVAGGSWARWMYIRQRTRSAT
ncbi:hypothetical protein LJK88_14800 [Paenibacillus sp. P26]|nr:hypothetical protein LJK88_14800 [Paenibacillus sp. P26]